LQIADFRLQILDYRLQITGCSPEASGADFRFLENRIEKIEL